VENEGIVVRIVDGPQEGVEYVHLKRWTILRHQNRYYPCDKVNASYECNWGEGFDTVEEALAFIASQLVPYELLDIKERFWWAKPAGHKGTPTQQ
jgi:hypothetical protein